MKTKRSSSSTSRPTTKALPIFVQIAGTVGSWAVYCLFNTGWGTFWLGILAAMLATFAFRKTRYIRTFSWVLVSGILCSSQISTCVAADAIDFSRVEKVLIAEAGNQGFEGMLAVAEVMRERSWNMRPFCASRRADLDAFVAKQPQRVKEQAHKAVEQARNGSNTVNGATHYENVEAFGTPKWAVGKKAVAKVVAHTFWKL